MKKNSFLWAALSMTAALVMTACSSDDNMTETPQTPSTSKKIPYTVTVGEATTRATVDGDNKTLKFATGDKLYITGDDIQGVLDLQDGDEGKTSGATFSGELTYSGSGSPASDLSLTATLVSAQQNDGAEITVNATTGAVTVNYPTTAYCSSVNDAVQKYSRLTGTSTYGAKSFSLTQQTAFLNFEITFADGTTTGTELTAVVNNNSLDICSASVTTETVSEKVVAKFVLPVAKGTTLSSANVKFDDRVAISFGASQMLDGKVYNVKRTTVTWNSTNVFNESHKDDKLNPTNTTPLTYEGITISLSGTYNSGIYNSSFYPYSGNRARLVCYGDYNDSFTFTAPSGKKFTKIEIINNNNINFTAYGDWTQPETTKIVWRGTAANAVTLGGSNMTIASYLNSIVFTLE